MAKTGEKKVSFEMQLVEAPQDCVKIVKVKFHSSRGTFSTWLVFPEIDLQDGLESQHVSACKSLHGAAAASTNGSAAY